MSGKSSESWLGLPEDQHGIPRRAGLLLTRALSRIHTSSNRAVAQGDESVFTHRFLIRQHLMDLAILDFRQHATLHDCPPFVILDVPDPSFSGKTDLLTESLFSEVSYGVVVCISEEIVDCRVGCSYVVFEAIHEVGSVTLHVSLPSFLPPEHRRHTSQRRSLPLRHRHWVCGARVEWTSGTAQHTLTCSELSTAQKTISAKPRLSKGR